MSDVPQQPSPIDELSQLVGAAVARAIIESGLATKTEMQHFFEDRIALEKAVMRHWIDDESERTVIWVTELRKKLDEESRLNANRSIDLRKRIDEVAQQTTSQNDTLHIAIANQGGQLNAIGQTVNQLLGRMEERQEVLEAMQRTLERLGDSDVRLTNISERIERDMYGIAGQPDAPQSLYAFRRETLERAGKVDDTLKTIPLEFSRLLDEKNHLQDIAISDMTAQFKAIRLRQERNAALVKAGVNFILSKRGAALMGAATGIFSLLIEFANRVTH